MIPDNQTEGNSSAQTGAAEQPTSPASGAQSQPLPDYITVLQGQVDQLTNQLKGLQKGTDKQIGQVRGDIKRILELKEKGLDETGIQRELFLDQLMSGQNVPVQQPTGSGKQPDAGSDAEKMISTLQFSPNDPALAALRIKHSGNPQGLAVAAAELRLQQLQTPNPSPATSPSVQGSASGASTATDKITHLADLQKNPTKNKAEIQRLTAELEASGWK